MHVKVKWIWTYPYFDDYFRNFVHKWKKGYKKLSTYFNKYVVRLSCDRSHLEKQMWCRLFMMLPNLKFLLILLYYMKWQSCRSYPVLNYRELISSLGYQVGTELYNMFFHFGYVMWPKLFTLPWDVRVINMRPACLYTFPGVCVCTRCTHMTNLYALNKTHLSSPLSRPSHTHKKTHSKTHCRAE